MVKLSFNPDRNTKIVLVAVLIFGLLGGAVSFTPIIYEGGWEVKTNLESVTVNSATYDADNLPAHNYSSWGAAYVKFDADEEVIGIPTLSVQLSSPIEYISQEGEWVEAREDEVYKKIVVKVGDNPYFFYHHVFFFEVRVIAEAEYMNVWGLISGEAKDMREVIQPQITVMFEIDAGLWAVLDTITSDDGLATYREADVWTGVMSASVDESSGGYVKALPEGFNGVPGAWSITNVGRLNMFHATSTDTYSDKSLEDFQSNPAVIEGVPSVIRAEVAGTSLIPGWWWPAGGTIGTYAVQAEYRIRFDVVTSAFYTFQQGDQDDKLDNASIEDAAGEGVFGDLSAFLEKLDAVLKNPMTGVIAIVSVIAVVVVLYFVLRIIMAARGN